MKVEESHTHYQFICKLGLTLQFLLRWLIVVRIEIVQKVESFFQVSDMQLSWRPSGKANT